MNKTRVLSAFLWLILLALMVVPAAAQAQGWLGGNLWESIGLGGMERPFGYGTGLMGVIAIIINIAFALAGLVAVVFLIMGGYSYVTAGGNPEQIEMAKARIVNSIIGMVVILVSYLIVQFIMTQIGATNIGLPRSADWGR